jgi:predicted phosphate transport protein (TIGR00153 family)
VRLTPQDGSFYVAFRELGDHLVRGAGLLDELLQTDPAGRSSIIERMRTVEHEMDEATHELLRKTNSSFITPFDREDIYRLANDLDDVMDAMEAAVDLMGLYGVGELPEEMREQIELLNSAAVLTADAMPRLRTMKDLTDYFVEANRLENRADQVHRKLLARLFSGSFDAMTVMKLKDVAEELEAAADGFEDVANTIESIAVKES